MHKYYSEPVYSTKKWLEEELIFYEILPRQLNSDIIKEDAIFKGAIMRAQSVFISEVLDHHLAADVHKIILSYTANFIEPPLEEVDRDSEDVIDDGEDNKESRESRESGESKESKESKENRKSKNDMENKINEDNKINKIKYARRVYLHIPRKLKTWRFNFDDMKQKFSSWWKAIHESIEHKFDYSSEDGENIFKLTTSPKSCFGDDPHEFYNYQHPMRSYVNTFFPNILRHTEFNLHYIRHSKNITDDKDKDGNKNRASNKIKMITKLKA